MKNLAIALSLAFSSILAAPLANAQARPAVAVHQMRAGQFNPVQAIRREERREGSCE